MEQQKMKYFSCLNYVVNSYSRKCGFIVFIFYSKAIAKYKCRPIEM